MYDQIDPKKTAFIVIDMQNAFCQEGAPVEVPLSRDVVPNINKLAAELRTRGGDNVWVISEFNHHSGRSDWENFFTHIVASEVRDRTMKYMEPGAIGTQLWSELDARYDDIYLTKNR